MEIKNDFIMRAIKRLLEIMRKMMGKEEVSDEILDKVVRDACDIDLGRYTGSPAVTKYLVELFAANDENRKALVVTCLMLKDKGRYQQICYELLENIKWNLLHDDAKELLRMMMEKPRK